MGRSFSKTLKKGFWGGISIYLLLVIKALSQFVISIILVNGLSKEGYGTFKLFESLLLIGVSLCSLGLSSSLLRYGTELYVKNKIKALIRLLFGMLKIRGVLIISLSLVAIIFKDEVVTLLNLDVSNATLIPLLAIILFFTSMNDLFGTAFHRVRLDQISDSVNQIIVKLFITLGFYFVIFKKYGLFALLLVLFLSEIIRTMLYGVTNVNWFNRIKKKLKEAFGENYFDKDFIKRVKKFTLYYFVASIINIFRSLLVDNLIIGYYLDTKKVAIYAFSATLITFADRLNIAGIFRGILSPIFVSRYTDTGKTDELIWGFRLLCKLIIFLTLPAFVFLILIGDKIIVVIFSKEYLDAVVPISLMCIFFFVAGFIYPFMTLLNTIEKNELIMFGGIFSVYNLISGIILVKKFGIMGAVFATGSAQVLLCLFYWYSTKWYIKLDISFPWVSLLKTTMNLFPIIFLTILFKKHITSISTLILYIIIYGILYFGASYINKVFNDNERNLFNNAIGKRLWVF